MGGKGSGRRDKHQRRKVEGLLGAVLQTDIPARVIGVAQCGGLTVPTTCPHCHAGAPDWAVNAWEGHCRCGATWFRLIGEIRFHVHRQRTPIYYAEAPSD